MDKNVIFKGCLFLLKSKLNCLIEIEKLEGSQAIALVYDETGHRKHVAVDISDLKGIPLSILVLKSLGFEEKEGRLMGLPYEHYWLKRVNGYNLCIIDDGGTLKLATINADAYYGIKFSPVPFLHELQKIIGSIDLAKLFKDMQSAE